MSYPDSETRQSEKCGQSHSHIVPCPKVLLGVVFLPSSGIFLNARASC